MKSRHLSAVISADPNAVYAFAAAPENLPKWAAGLTEAAAELRGDQLVVTSPMGEVTVKFVPPNDFGVLDHEVTLPTGAVVTNPLRVLTHPDGADVVLTLRQLDLSDDDFDRDAAIVPTSLGSRPSWKTRPTEPCHADPAT